MCIKFVEVGWFLLDLSYAFLVLLPVLGHSIGGEGEVLQVTRRGIDIIPAAASSPRR